MNVRHFTAASSDYIQLSLGAVPAFGDTTIVALLKRSSDQATGPFIFEAGLGPDPADWIFYLSGSGENKLGLWTGTVEMKSTFTVTAADGWVMVACSKQGGTVAPRFHKGIVSANTWTHTNSPTAGANSGAVATHSVIGTSSDHSGAFFDGHILAMGIWGSILTDETVVALAPHAYVDFPALVTGWLATTPVAMWRLDQASTATAVNDQTAGAANQNAIGGTSVVTNDDPTFAPAVAANSGVAQRTAPALFSVVELT